jgi:hypothetical protein
MARRLWGCYSVADHLEPRAFVADLLLYDRLVVPVPAPDDVARWEEHWDPGRQQRLLKILGGLAERVEWSAPLREQFHELLPEDAPPPTDAALDIDESNPDPARPYELTRRIIGEQLRKKVVQAKDVRGVAVYAKPDQFDREWQFSKSFPFIRRTTRVEPGVLREAADPLPADQQQLAKVVVTRLIVPDDGQDDEEVLKRTVELVSRDDVATKREAFHQLIASLDAQGLQDETIVGEVSDYLDGLNESVRRHTKAQKARLAVQFVTAAEGAAALWAPPIALAAGPSAAAGEAIIKRRWGGDADPALGAVALLAEAQRALS